MTLCDKSSNSAVLMSAGIIVFLYRTVQLICLEEKEIVNATAFPVPQITGFASKGAR